MEAFSERRKQLLEKSAGALVIFSVDDVESADDVERACRR